MNPLLPQSPHQLFESAATKFVDDCVSTMQVMSTGGAYEYSAAIEADLACLGQTIEALGRLFEKLRADLPKLRRMHNKACTLMQRPPGKA